MALYDSKPSKLEAVGNGSFLYRYNIVEVEVESSTSEGQEARTQWQCEEVTIWQPVTSNKITEAVIATQWPANYEQKLVNEYNAATLGLIDGSKSSDAAKAKIQAYKDFLNERAALKAAIDADCEELDIK